MQLFLFRSWGLCPRRWGSSKMPQYFLEPAMPLAMAASPTCDIPSNNDRNIENFTFNKGLTFDNYQKLYFIYLDETLEKKIIFSSLCPPS